MSLVHFLSKFSQEAIVLELFLISFITTCYFGYLLIQKRKYGAAKNNIPDNVVRAFLVEIISYCNGFKNQLFGQEFKIEGGLKQAFQAVSAEYAVGASSQEIIQLKNQLVQAQAKQEEFNKSIAQLTAEKGSLTEKLAIAQKSGGGAASPEAAKELGETKEKIKKLEAKLFEYEVIEDDLANLKKYQQENKQLRAQLDALQGKGGTAVQAAASSSGPVFAPQAPESVAAAEITPPATPQTQVAPAAPSPIAAAEASVQTATAEAHFEKLVDKVEESITAPAGASVKDPLAAASIAPATSVDTPPPVAAASAQPKSEKSDEDLLSEFEKMLNT